MPLIMEGLQPTFILQDMLTYKKYFYLFWAKSMKSALSTHTFLPPQVSYYKVIPYEKINTSFLKYILCVIKHDSYT